MRDFDAEVQRLFDVYNAAWVHNWGFAPMSQAEVTHLAKQVKPLANPDLVLLVEAPDGETVAVAVPKMTVSGVAVYTGVAGLTVRCPFTDVTV